MSTVTTATVEARGSLLQRLLRDQLLQRLRRLRSGAVRWRWPGGDVVTGNADGALRTVVVDVVDPAFWSAVALRGSLGAGEAFVQAQWHCDDPVRLVRILLRDRDVLDACDGGLARLAAPAQRLWHWLRRNTRTGSRRNIAAHYDLGDDFFAAFLDPGMTYSAALFASPQNTLEQAQQHKLRRLCAKLRLGAGARLLEIGTGWGSMSLCAAGEFGAAVTTTTISARQLAAARARVAAAGLGDRVGVIASDYRDLEGQFDHVLNVEMVEAVGHRFLPGFFGACAARLRPAGTMAMQAITIADQHYAAALHSVDFIKRYVFPGSFIPSVTALVDAATAGSDLRLLHLEDFGRHYAETLRRWRHNLMANRAAIRGAGHGDELLRTWDWYLAYCEAGFAERYLSVVQAVFGRPGALAPRTADLERVADDPYAA